jgi:transposase
MNTSSAKQAEVGNNLSVTKKYQTIKLGIDWHAREYRVVRIIDNAGPEPAQRFTPAKFLEWAARQTQLAHEVHTVYEAGPGGFVLHRQLVKLGIKNLVVAPQRQPQKGRQKNDKLDAMQLALDLDRYLRGNPKALCVVFVPTPEQEQSRHETRQREQLRCHRLALATQGRSLLLSQGWVKSNSWWKIQTWARLRDEVPQWLLERLETYREQILHLEKQLGTMTRKIEAAAPVERPKGVGPLTMEQIDREVGDWNRFANRKSPGAYCGLVGGFESSGEHSKDLPITKMGNGRLRVVLVEAAWRLVIYQPQCPMIQRWRSVLLNPDAHKRARKRAIIAVARQLFVDLWRWRTGRRTAEQLGWVMMGAGEHPAGKELVAVSA